MTATYLYAIVPTSKCVPIPDDGVSVQPGGIRTLPYGDIAAVVGPSGLEDYRSLGREDLVAVLLEHQRVVERVMSMFTVLPAKFGTVLASERRVVELLSLGHDVFRAELDRLEGYAQIEVLVLWDLDEVFADLGRDERVAHLRAAVEAAAPDEAKGRQVLVGQLVETLLKERRATLQSRLLPRLQELGLEVLSNPCMDDSMALNLAFLMDERDRKRLDALLHELDEEFEGRLTFRCVGPLPSYSFATLEVESPSFADVDKARRLLKLPKTVTARQVKEAYRRLAAEAHPDLNPDPVGGAVEISDLGWAYRLLFRFVTAHVDGADGEEGTGLPCPLDLRTVDQAVLFKICRQEMPVP